MSQWVVVDSPDEKRLPTVIIRPAGGSRSEEKRYLMPSHAHLMVRDGEEVFAGDVRRQDPARHHQDQGHHRRPAARGRTVRSAQAARDGHHLRDQRRGAVRRSRQGHAQGPCRRRRRPAARVPDPARRPHQRAGRRARARRRSAHGRAAQSARHPARARREANCRSTW